jgi:hypothetical protein
MDDATGEAAGSGLRVAFVRRLKLDRRERYCMHYGFNLIAVDETTGVLPKAKAVFMALLAALYVGCGGMMVSGSLVQANNAIEARNYQDALKLLSQAERYATDAGPQKQAEIAYLRGVCLEGLGRNADAEGQFQFVVDRFPNTEYGYRAKEWLKHKGEQGSP